MRRKLIFCLCIIMLLVMASCALESKGGGMKEADTTSSPATETKTQKRTTDPNAEFVLKLDLNSDDNIAFSKYDMNAYFDGEFLKRLANGEKYSTILNVASGRHELKITKAEDETLNCVEEIEMAGDKTLVYEIDHGKKKIELKIKETKDYVEGINESKTTNETESETETEEKIVTEKETETETERITEANTEKPEPVYYSTNDLATAKLGNSGAFSYKQSGMEYTIYYIIDFDQGYVFRFVDGDGSDTCDRLKIDSGDLNEGVSITYHDGGDQWKNYLHFKWKNRPDHLVLVDDDLFETDFQSTDYISAVRIRGSKKMVDY